MLNWKVIRLFLGKKSITEVKIKLSDNSTFSVKNKDQISALKMKLQVDDISLEEFIPIFVEEVKKHWNNKTVPTKFPWDISWKKYFENKESIKINKKTKNRFKNQAELAEKVFYQYIRPYLMGILLSKATKGKSGSIVTSDKSISFVKDDFLVSKKIDDKEISDNNGVKNNNGD